MQYKDFIQVRVQTFGRWFSTLSQTIFVLEATVPIYSFHENYRVQQAAFQTELQTCVQNLMKSQKIFRSAQ